MRDDLTTIPISDIFEKTEGCPVCRLRAEVESRTVEFILGGAMMEPDVRISTNKKGFCSTHFSQMLERKNKLAVALMLDSHLSEIDEKLLTPGGFLKKSVSARFPLAREITEDCFICERVQNSMSHLLDTLVRTYAKDSDFRKMFEAQPMMCLVHYHAVCDAAKALNKKDGEKLINAAAEVTRKGLTELRSDVAWFCQKHDYRNATADWGNSKDAVERAVKFLTSR